MTHYRRLTDHEISDRAVFDPMNGKVRVEVLDEPGPGNACHQYLVTAGESRTHIAFQNGPLHEVGVNGLTNEALLAIVADRLRGFQTGPYKCPENQYALLAVEDTMRALRTRTRERLRRGVEGTLVV